MSFFNRSNREGHGRPLPEIGAGRAVTLFFTYFWQLVWANMLFVLFSLPVITMPAALCALNRVCILIYRNGHCFLWTEFWKEFRSSFLRSLLPGLLFGVLLFVGYFFMSLAAANAHFPVWCLIFWFVGIVAAVAGACWGAYFFALVPLLDGKNPVVLKNAYLLCFLRPGSALLVLGTLLGMCFVAMVLMPIFIVALLLFWFVLMQYIICYLVNDVAEDYILRPFAEQQKNNI